MSSDHEIDAETASRAVEILESSQGTYSRVDEADSAIDTLEKVLSATPPGPLRTTILSNLGLIRMARFQLTASPSDLDAAIACLWDAHGTQEQYGNHPALSATIPNLISALHTRATVTGDWDDLDEAIAWGRDAVVRLPPGLPQRAAALVSLSSALRIRYERSRYNGDLTEAIDLARQAAADLPDDHPRLGSALSNLGSALMASGLAGESVSVYRRALDKFHDVGNRGGEARTMNNLAGALTQSGRIDEALTTYRRALEEFRTIGDRQGEERVMNNLAAARALAEVRDDSREEDEGLVRRASDERRPGPG
ncbi:tetratricopeptide repeat protein [Streptomyces sp. AK02-01A]|uniref:tetratricopeptide repeat protein n=1 Tax=Streptomyces sp. AK02-01A TaxID=3028648 RepID=UPI0029AEECB8|nr:tetratricopeptide repeat protein [Streptomyces sp. AK02-01A]MDX3855636.1 tetratricopeptide repeat protein [Streptomyces sp. AK02-01A]